MLHTSPWTSGVKATLRQTQVVPGSAQSAGLPQVLAQVLCGGAEGSARPSTQAWASGQVSPGRMGSQTGLHWAWSQRLFSQSEPPLQGSKFATGAAPLGGAQRVSACPEGAWHRKAAQGASLVQPMIG